MCSLIATYFLFVVASVNLQINCARDMVMLLCFVRSNSENPYLEWEVTLPGANESIRVSYRSIVLSDINVVRNLDKAGFITLTNYIPPQKVNSQVLNGYIESAITLTTLMDRSGVVVKCATDLNQEMTLVLNTSGMCMYASIHRTHELELQVRMLD